MPSSFTHYWSQSTSFTEGDPFDHTAGSRFSASGVSTGDRIFGVTLHKGVPFLIGRMTVTRPPVDYKEACRLLPYEPWNAPEHLIGDRSTASLQYRRMIPASVSRALRFESPSGETALKFVAERQLDPQTLRGLRKLTPASAELLETLLETDTDGRNNGLIPVYPDEINPSVGFPEGAKKQVTVNAYERNPLARLACIAELGCACVACGFDFEAYYGELGRGFIHVHHIRSISECGGTYVVDPIKDLIPVCPNCHAMLHRGPIPISLEELRAFHDSRSTD